MDLSETAKLMMSQSWRDRLKAEYWQVRTRRTRLLRMIKGMYGHDEDCLGVVDLMQRQADIMREYMRILEKRAEAAGIDLEVR